MSERKIDDVNTTLHSDITVFADPLNEELDKNSLKQEADESSDSVMLEIESESSDSEENLSSLKKRSSSCKFE